MRNACSVPPSRITHHASRATSSFFLFLLLLFLAGCAVETPDTAVPEPFQITLIADGESFNLITEATNVRELLAEAGVTLGESDEITPPVYTPLTGGETITVVRISESIETTTQSIPFARKIVRNESMTAEDPPLIVQAGKDGLQETTIRIVYRDGLEAERWPTQTAVIEEPQDEIVMVGIGAAGGNVSFPGVLAYISDGTAVFLRGESAFPEQLAVGGQLDGRVFSLSPSGDYLLYSRVDGDPAVFNNALYVIQTQRSAEPRALGVENVLWADWNPAGEAEIGEIAYTTAVSITTPPGWEANNDLWRVQIPPDPEDDLEPEQIVEAYAALYSWWGGNFAWSPTGAQIAYSYANEVGLINLDPPRDVPQRVQLQTFTEFDPPGDWVWVPTLAWSPDGRFLAYTGHDSPDPEDPTFANWVVDTTGGVAGRFVPDAGMWAHLHWATNPAAAAPLAFLRTTDPLDSQRSSYTLWLMDRDGSNARQIYPPANENSYFPRQQAFMAWGPTGEHIAFIFNNDLYLYTLADGTARPLTEGDAVNTHPTWAPYGTAVTAPLPAAPTALPPDTPGRGP
ncbi:MAG: G5 domain-containing protein [Chloroflexi bacterium]|nr:G5 domain-containing protein [Chloroflexota bacterium]